MQKAPEQTGVGFVAIAFAGVVPAEIAVRSDTNKDVNASFADVRLMKLCRALRLLRINARDMNAPFR